MKSLTLYRIMSWFLLAVAGVFALLLLNVLVAALINPLMLLPVLLFGSVIVYTFSAWKFLRKGVDAYQYCKPSLRDTIRITGSISIFVGFMTIANSTALLLKPEVLDQVMRSAAEMQKEATEEMQARALAVMKMLLPFMLVYAIVLVVHVFMTNRLLREHADAFET